MRRFLSRLVLPIVPLVGGCLLCSSRESAPSPQSSAPVSSEHPEARSPALPAPWTNSLGMRFLPVAGTEVQFGVWDVRVQDYAAFVKATGRKSSQGMRSLRGQRYYREFCTPTAGRSKSQDSSPIGNAGNTWPTSALSSARNRNSLGTFLSSTASTSSSTSIECRKKPTVRTWPISRSY